MTCRLLLLLLLAPGCGTDGDRVAPTQQPGRPGVEAEIQAGFRLDEAWVEVAPAGGSAAAYISLSNHGEIGLPFVAVLGRDAKEVQFVCDSVHPRHLGLNGFQLDPGEGVRMHRDGTHYQLTGLKRSFVVGERVGITLVLLNGMRFHVELEVRDTPPTTRVPSAPLPPTPSSLERLT
jgi:copper(I)-binding protein